MIWTKFTYIFYVLICTLFLNIASTDALARNYNVAGQLVLGPTVYHETQLHNLDDVANLGVESAGTPSDRQKELTEILEDESQSPDEQSVSRFDENVKVFTNPVVLEVTSKPSEDELKDFEKVKEHEEATEDRHFDSLKDLVNSGWLSKSNPETPAKPVPNPKDSQPNHDDESWSLGHLLKKLVPGAKDNHNKENNDNNNQERHVEFEELVGHEDKPHVEFGNLAGAGVHPELAKHLPPMTLNAHTQNHFLVNVHHHYPKHHKHHNAGLQPYVTRECFQEGVPNVASDEQCYCSKDPECKCDKTFVLTNWLCQFLMKNPDMLEFCLHKDPRGNVENGNHNVPESEYVSVVFNAFQKVLCVPDVRTLCSEAMDLEAKCQCTKC